MVLLSDTDPVASIILAAGRGSRMSGFQGNKTLLPLITKSNPFEGELPILVHIIKNLPEGPKLVVVNYKKEDVMHATKDTGVYYVLQPETNGTGGALLASRSFLENGSFEKMIITMGDVPLVKAITYRKLALRLEMNDMVVLAFSPSDKKQYGLLEIEGERVKRIIEFSYWSEQPNRYKDLRLVNAGIYAAKRTAILKCLPELESRPHSIVKTYNGVARQIKEFFITDLVEIMNNSGMSVGFLEVQDEREVLGVDDLGALKTAQRLFSLQ